MGIKISSELTPNRQVASLKTCNCSNKSIAFQDSVKLPLASNLQKRFWLVRSYFLNYRHTLFNLHEDARLVPENFPPFIFQLLHSNSSKVTRKVQKS